MKSHPLSSVRSATVQESSGANKAEGVTGTTQSKSVKSAYDVLLATVHGDNRKQHKGCNCRNSKCLKMYCECFADGGYCGPECTCIKCLNKPDYENLRDKAIEAVYTRNPIAFQSKNARDAKGSPLRLKGCSCRKSGCLKKYCECFSVGVTCGPTCKCCNCHNKEGDLLLLEQLVRSAQNVRSPRPQKAGPSIPLNFEHGSPGSPANSGGAADNAPSSPATPTGSGLPTWYPSSPGGALFSPATSVSSSWAARTAVGLALSPIVLKEVAKLMCVSGSDHLDTRGGNPMDEEPSCDAEVEAKVLQELVTFLGALQSDVR